MAALCDEIVPRQCVLQAVIHKREQELGAARVAGGGRTVGAGLVAAARGVDGSGARFKIDAAAGVRIRGISRCGAAVCGLRKLRFTFHRPVLSHAGAV